MIQRVYCEGALSKALLASKLDEGLVLTDNVRRGYSGGDVAYFRAGTPGEIADCRRLMVESSKSASSGGSLLEDQP